MPFFKTSSLKTIRIHRWMFWVAAIGLFASTYLLITYISGGPIVCGVSSGCETVRASRWANSFGIPRPAFGVFFYGFIILLLCLHAMMPAWKARWTRSLMLLATTVGLVESGLLTVVQAVDVKAFCIWCLISATAATAVFVLSLFESRDEWTHPLISEMKYLLRSLAIAFVVGAFGIWFLLGGRLNLGASTSSSSSTVSGTDWISSVMPFEGPADAKVTIVEYIDYECPSCSAYHSILKKVREDYQGKIRFQQRVFPLVEIHKHAKGSAIAGVCATKQGRYFDYADALVLNQRDLERADLLRYAAAFNFDQKTFETCLDDPATATFVDAERKAGERVGVQGTPTLFINGQRYDNMLTDQQLRQAIDVSLTTSSNRP